MAQRERDLKRDSAITGSSLDPRSITPSTITCGSSHDAVGTPTRVSPGGEIPVAVEPPSAAPTSETNSETTSAKSQSTSEDRENRQEQVPVEPPVDQPRWLAREDEEAPVRPALTRRRIVVTALRLVEEHGLEALTMRRVASALHVTPMSLYNHVSDKAELVDLMVDFLIGDVVAKSADDQGDWEAKLRAQAIRNHEMWRSHPGFVRVYAEGVTMGPNGLANAERALGILREAGFSDEDAGGGFMLLYRWSMSTLLVGRTRPVSRHQSLPSAPKTKQDRVRAYFAALPLEEIPNIEASAMYLSGSSIDFGLDVIIAGLKTKLQVPRRAQAAETAVTAEPAEPTERQSATESDPVTRADPSPEH